MITEAQRRALFALREALHLCDEAGIYISPENDYDGYRRVLEIGGQLQVSDVDRVLAEHPET